MIEYKYSQLLNRKTSSICLQGFQSKPAILEANGRYDAGAMWLVEEMC